MKKAIITTLLFGVSFIPTSLYIKSQVGAERYTSVVQECLPKTVSIYVTIESKGKEGRCSGSGVFISPNGHILSCAHLFVGWKVKSVTVETNSGDVYPAIVLLIDAKKDLSLVKIEGKGMPYASLASLHSIVEGLEVIAIGSPLGLPGTVTTGVISATHRDVVGYDQVQMSAPINPGNSGGPLFNRKGELVGINIITMSAVPLPIFSGIGFSVSASEINKFFVNFRGLESVAKARP